MTSKNVYWIADENGVKACVTGAPARDFWVKVQGYSETSEPAGQEFQHVRNDNHGGYGVLNHEAVLLLGGLGWRPSEPPPVPGAPETPAETTVALSADVTDYVPGMSAAAGGTVEE